MNNGLTGFERAVAGALDDLGAGVLERPQQFAGVVSDLHDPDSAEVVVLCMHCSREMLRPFAEAAREGTAGALGQAAIRVEFWLRDVRRVNADDARAVAWGIASGLAAHLGAALTREPSGGRQPGWDDATRAAVEMARAALADAGATEADVAGALASVRALPASTQGRAALEAALEGRLAKLVAERRAEEARLRREAQERKRREAEEARLRREAEERKKREAEERARAEAARRRHEAQQVARQGATRTDSERKKNDPKSGKRWLGVVLAVIASLGAAVVLAVCVLNAQKTIGYCSWSELKNISEEIARAESDEEGLKIAKEYNLVDSDGRLRGDTKAVMLTDGTEAHVRILGFRQDVLAGGGKAGITFEFADVPAKHRMNAEKTNSGGWEKSEMREWL